MGESVITGYRQTHSKRIANLRRRVWEKTGGTCWLCGGLITTSEEATLDHIKPRPPRKANGKRPTPRFDDVMPAHEACNKERGAASLRAYPVARQWLTICEQRSRDELVLRSRSLEIRQEIKRNRLEAQG